jgi:hypothetical protein
MFTTAPVSVSHSPVEHQPKATPARNRKAAFKETDFDLDAYNKAEEIFRSLPTDVTSDLCTVYTYEYNKSNVLISGQKSQVRAFQPVKKTIIDTLKINDELVTVGQMYFGTLALYPTLSS